MKFVIFCLLLFYLNKNGPFFPYFFIDIYSNSFFFNLKKNMFA